MFNIVDKAPRKRRNSSLTLNPLKKQKLSTPRLSCKGGQTSTPAQQTALRHTLDRAPKKAKCSRPSHKRVVKSLFTEEPGKNNITAQHIKNLEDHPLHFAIQEGIKLIPSLFECLHAHALLNDFLTLMRLIAGGKFPVDDIAFLLLLEVARWFGNSHTSQMHYSEETKLFWKIGYKLFHGKFFRFMSGCENKGTEISEDETRGNHDPQSSSINFAVPANATVRNFQVGVTVPKEVPPGVIQTALEMRSGEDTSFILSVDGKKVSAGLTDAFGDEDLWGYEKPSSIKERASRKQNELDVIEAIPIDTNSLVDEMNTMKRIKDAVTVLTHRVKDLRSIKVKQNIALDKFKKLAGEDWRNSKYVYAIS